MGGSRGPERQSGLAQDLFLHRLCHRQRAEFIEILLDIRNARPGPVRAEQRFVCDLFQAREVLQQGLWRNAADIEVYVGMTADQEECGLHPERAATVSEQYLELGEIHGDVVDVDRITVLVACSGK